MDRQHLIVVSNRGPAGYDRDVSGRRIRNRAAGGLVSALRPLTLKHDVTWIASAMTAEERRMALAGPIVEQGPGGSSFRLRLVAHDADAYEAFYDVISNPVLWFVQHDLWSLRQDPDLDLHGPWRRGYVPVNERFAEAVVQELDRDPAASVLFQDYHLYLAPALVRARRSEARLLHFVHIPWVDARGWSVLPEELSRAVHEGLLDADTVGFHTERWRAAFVKSCGELLGRGAEAEARSHANPIGVDVAELDRMAASPEVEEHVSCLLASRPERLVVRVDRTDPSKNALAGFAAFGRLLERRPDLRGRVGMVALLAPSRQGVPEYAAYLRQVESAVAAVNEAFAGSMPAIDLRIRDDFPSSVAAYRQYDVLLVNPVMDGLNLVAMEGPIVNERDGVVVLSRDAGAWELLGEWALGIDPRDIESTADALEVALALPAQERAARASGIRARVRSQDTGAWVERELAALLG